MFFSAGCNAEGVMDYAGGVYDIRERLYGKKRYGKNVCGKNEYARKYRGAVRYTDFGLSSKLKL